MEDLKEGEIKSSVWSGDTKLLLGVCLGDLYYSTDLKL